MKTQKRYKWLLSVKSGRYIACVNNKELEETKAKLEELGWRVVSARSEDVRTEARKYYRTVADYIHWQACYLASEM